MEWSSVINLCIYAKIWYGICGWYERMSRKGNLIEEIKLLLMKILALFKLGFFLWLIGEFIQRLKYSTNMIVVLGCILKNQRNILGLGDMLKQRKGFFKVEFGVFTAMKIPAIICMIFIPWIKSIFYWFQPNFQFHKCLRIELRDVPEY